MATEALNDGEVGDAGDVGEVGDVGDVETVRGVETTAKVNPVVKELRALIKRELANPGARRKAGPVRVGGVEVKGYRAPIVGRTDRGGDIKIGGINRSALMMAKLRKALREASRTDNQ
ncbi:MAG: hypothetical protein Q8P62_03055 [Candidatus Peregrinibacteria bacterium]|nr:hypothetical protein [Candidatus Peregrinibacteria bacterium]MDZ4210011.1 hypothetical protein [Candidatus Curtissbacteria bacterium]